MKTNKQFLLLAGAASIALSACGKKDDGVADSLRRDSTAMAPVTPAPAMVDSTAIRDSLARDSVRRADSVRKADSGRRGRGGE